MLPTCSKDGTRRERNGLQLHREIAAQGYKGSARMIYRYLDALQQQRANPDDIALAPFPQLTSRDAAWLFLRAPADLKKAEQDDVTTLCQASETAQTLYHLVQDFLHMVHHREGERLDEWLERVRASHIPESQRLVRSMQKDKAAVQAGLTLPYSNGIVEGKVNKLKLIKRMGYGRAGFPRLAPAGASRLVKSSHTGGQGSASMRYNTSNLMKGSC